jgi:transposase-like protein
MKKKSYSLRHRKWRCPDCGATLQVWVRMSATPTCHNPLVHDRRVVAMVPDVGFGRKEHTT